MLIYILKRLLLMVPTVLGVLTLTFVIIQFAPAAPVDPAGPPAAAARHHRHDT